MDVFDKIKKKLLRIILTLFKNIRGLIFYVDLLSTVYI